MRLTNLESVPRMWDDTRELPFFRITAGLFPSDFCEGASALLAENDEDAADQLCRVPVLRGR